MSKKQECKCNLCGMSIKVHSIIELKKKSTGTCEKCGIGYIYYSQPKLNDQVKQKLQELGLSPEEL